MSHYLKEKEIPKLKSGNKYTLFYVDSFMALSHRIEFTFQEYRIEPYAQYNETVVLFFKEKGKRKIKGMRLKEGLCIFEGWDIPLKIDTDFSSFSGSATINFVGKHKDIQNTLKSALFMNGEGTFVYVDETDLHNQQVVYPDKADKSHAVIERIMNKEVKA